MTPEMLDWLIHAGATAGSAGPVAFIAFRIAMNGLRKDVERMDTKLDTALNRLASAETNIEVLKVRVE